MEFMYKYAYKINNLIKDKNTLSKIYSKDNLAPIGITVYNRLDHTKRLFNFYQTNLLKIQKYIFL